MAVEYTGLFGHGTLKDTAKHVARTRGAKVTKKLPGSKDPYAGKKARVGKASDPYRKKKPVKRTNPVGKGWF